MEAVYTHTIFNLLFYFNIFFELLVKLNNHCISLKANTPHILRTGYIKTGAKSCLPHQYEVGNTLKMRLTWV